MFLPLSLCVVFFTSVVLSKSLSPCRATDFACMEKSINEVLPEVVAGNPELGIDISDPLFIDEMIGDLKVMRYKFVNSTYEGAKDAVISNLKVGKDFKTARFDIIFKHSRLYGLYELSGKLFDIPVEGSGDYLFTAGIYNISVKAELEKVRGEDGKTHVLIKDFDVDCMPLEPTTFEFKNLFNGQEDLAKAVRKLANENWLQVASFVQKPAWLATLRKLFNNINKYLKRVALEDFLLS